MTSAIFISDDLVQDLYLLKPIQAFSRVISLSFGMISICICTIASSNIHLWKLPSLYFFNYNLYSLYLYYCKFSFCIFASSLFALLKVLFLSYCKFYICTIEMSLFVLLQIRYLYNCTLCIVGSLFVLLQVLYLYCWKFCICPIASSVFVLLWVLYLCCWKFCICPIARSVFVLLQIQICWIWIPEEELQLHHLFNYSPNLWERQDAFQLSRFYVCIVNVTIEKHSIEKQRCKYL